ncbi:hypothetical protein [Emticicia fontis]
MDYNAPEVNFGSKIKYFGIFNFVCFAFILFGVHLSLKILASLALVALVFSFVMAYLDNNQNETNYKLLYLVYFVAVIMNIVVFGFCINMLSGRSSSMPTVFYAVLINLGLIPGYYLIKIYQMVLNKILHKKYWKEIERLENEKV